MPNAFAEPKEHREKEPPFPATVRIAGNVLIVFGILVLIFCVRVLVLGRVTRTADEGPVVILLLIVAVGGIFFILAGRQTLRGKVGDTLGIANWSIVIGLWPKTGGVAAFVEHYAIGNQTGDNVLINPAILWGLTVSGIALTLAGILALVGRNEYLEWRRWQKNRTTGKGQ